NSRPAAPANVTASAGQNQATVSWTPSTTSGVTGYIVTAHRGGNAENSVATNGNATSVTLSGLKGGSSYTFGVRATNLYGLGEEGTSDPVTPTGSGNTYASTVLAASPVTYYRFSEPSGTVAADSSGHAHLGAYSGTYQQAQPGALPSDPDSSASFNGGQVNAASDSELPTGN